MKRKIFLIILLVLGVLTMPVLAKEKDSDFFYANDNLTIDNKIAGTSFLAGNNVEVTSSAEIDGMNFVAGNNISVASKQDYLFTAGNSLNLEGVEVKDAFLAGSKINIQQSKIRDLYAAAGTIRIDSDIKRNAYLGGDEVTINSKIGGDVKIAADKIEIGEEAIIEGELKIPDSADVSIANKGNINKITTYKSNSSDEDNNIVDVIKGKVMSFLSVMIIALILMAMNLKVFRYISKIKKDSSTIVKTALSGFGFLVLTPIICIILLCTVLGIPLSIITIMLYGIMIYLSAIPTAYFFGSWILKDKIVNEYLLLIISMLVLNLLTFIPVIGGLVTFISLIMGLGIYLTLILQFSRKMRK